MCVWSKCVCVWTCVVSVNVYGACETCIFLFYQSLCANTRVRRLYSLVPCRKRYHNSVEMQTSFGVIPYSLKLGGGGYLTIFVCQNNIRTHTPSHTNTQHIHTTFTLFLTHPPTCTPTRTYIHTNTHSQSHAHTHTFIHTHRHIHKHTHTLAQAPTHTYTFTQIHTLTHTQTHILMRAQTHSHAHIHHTHI